jgi:hypothetical protein
MVVAAAVGHPAKARSKNTVTAHGAMADRRGNRAWVRII